MNRRVLSIFGLNPFRIGSNEAFAREISRQLGQQGWDSVLCFTAVPPPAVRDFLGLPNVAFDVLEGPCEMGSAGIGGLHNLLRRWRPEIVHCHYTGFISPSPWLAKLTGAARVFFTDHTSRETGYSLRRAAAWKRMAARCINWPMSGVVCVSDFGYRCVTALDLIAADRVRRIYNGVDLSLFGGDAGDANHFRECYAIPAGRPVVVQISWIRPEKGVPEMLEAARRILDRRGDVHFVIAGEGPDRPEYTEQAKSMGLGGHVTWTGTIDNPSASGLYEAADVVCQPSRWEEVFGWVITEAMASFKPVVATRVGGIPELVDDGQTGFLVERGDAPALAERILRLLEDPALRQRMGRAGRRKVEEKFDLRRNVAELLAWYGVG